MTVDSRAYTWCSLGPLAEGGGSSIAESHIQGSGLVTLRGTLNLAGIYRPATGTVVNLAYSDGQNWLARLPLRLRVLSSFANPLSRTTAVSVGCDLAYFEDRKPGTTLTARQANPDTPELVWRTATPAIPASWLVGQILSTLGLSAAGGIPLTNHKTVQEFDLSAGYVEELGKLAASECYAARMNPAGQVEFIYKAPDLDTSVLLSEDDLIDLNPINTGTLPAESVFAKYTSLKLKAPDPGADLQARNWEKEVSWSLSSAIHYHRWTSYETTAVLDSSGAPVYKQAKNSYGYPLVWLDTGKPVMEQVFEVKATERTERISFGNYTETTTDYDNKDRVTRRYTWSRGLNGVTSSETFYQYGADGEVEIERSSEFSPIGPLRISLGFQGPFSTAGQYQTSYREVRYERDKTSGITKTTTLNAVPYINTESGSEAISRLRDSRQPWVSVDDLVTIASALVEEGSEVRIRTERQFGTQRRPSEAERTATANQKAPTVEQQAEAVWAVGSAATQTSLELSPPYVSDDRIVATGGTYSVVKSDADQKALAYATTENRLLLGHRNGVGIQVPPEQLPPTPLGLIYIRLNGCTAAFRCNGTTWNLDPSGVTATTDALFWGAIDGTVADAWFPLPPDQSTLPSAVAVSVNANPRPANAINIPEGFSFGSPNLSSLFAALPTDQAPVFAKTVTPGAMVKPYRETISVQGGGGGGVIVTTQPWIPQTIEQRAGSGGGAVVRDGGLLRVGGGGGVTAQAVPLSQLLAGGGGGVIASSLAASNALAGGGGGAITTGEAQPMLSFTGGTEIAWGEASLCYGVKFALSSPKAIKAIGVYDAGGNGLSVDYVALIGNSDTDWQAVFQLDDYSTLLSFDAAGSTKFPDLSVSASPPLDGAWRRFEIVNGRLLSPGTYTLLLAPYYWSADGIIKSAASVTTIGGVSSIENQYVDFETKTLVTVSGDGLGYFGPILFF